MEQSNNEKAKLQKELDHTREENGNLRRDLKLKDEAAAILKVRIIGLQHYGSRNVCLLIVQQREQTNSPRQ